MNGQVLAAAADGSASLSLPTGHHMTCLDPRLLMEMQLLVAWGSAISCCYLILFEFFRFAPEKWKHDWYSKKLFASFCAYFP